MSKLSKIVVDHIETLLAPFDTSQCPLKASPRPNLSDRETQLFWRYQGRFPQEFAQALINQLPEELTFVSYDHLQNKLNVTGGH